MGVLRFGANVSLDGYVEDAWGSIEWTAPDEEVHQFWNDFERPAGTFLYGRRLYETMRVWETPEEIGDSPVLYDYATVWQAAEKIVFSRTLDPESLSTARTRLERDFDPDMVRGLKASHDGLLTVGGASLAGEAFRAGLVDEVALVVLPVVLGGGKPALPAGVRTSLELLDTRRFDGGAVFLHYRVVA
jgi:dihydrofolate reductase